MPKSFIFSLQPLLEHRRRLEDRERRVFEARRLALDDAGRIYDRLSAKLSRHTAANSSQASFQARDAQLHESHARSLLEAIQTQSRVVTDRCTELEAARNDFIAASRNRKVLQTLRDRRYAAFLSEAARFEQSEIDESNLHLRRNATRTGY